MQLFPTVLILSNKFDFSTDLITIQLAREGVSYLRLNRDQFELYDIDLDPLIPVLRVRYDETQYEITEQTLHSIYYRAPTFLRDIYQPTASAEEQLYRTQWAAFVRSLDLFEKVKWVNNPVATYRAENKPLQLLLARKAGFLVPSTHVTNRIAEKPVSPVAIKSLDTAIVHDNDQEAFVYTRIVDPADITDVRYRSPFIVQQALIPKIDLRVTVIENQLVAVSLVGEKEINEDWRLYKDSIHYEIIQLPLEIEAACKLFTQSLSLNFAAIDLILHNNQYFFIEVNPTGEWSWLQKNTGFRFDQLITKSLSA